MNEQQLQEVIKNYIKENLKVSIETRVMYESRNRLELCLYWDDEPFSQVEVSLR